MTTTFAPRPAPAVPGPYFFPTPDVVTLENGLRVEHFPSQDRLITVTLVAGRGTSAEPRGKEGVASLAADLRSEGTAHHSGEELSTALDLIGARLNSRVTEGATITTVTVPGSGLQEALHLLGETVTAATYPEDEFARLLTENVQEAKHQLADPGFRAEIELRAAMFDASDRASRPNIGTLESLAALSRDDVLSFDRENLSPAGATLVIGGLLEGDLRSLLEGSSLSTWTGPAVAAARTPAAAPTAHRVVIVDRPEAVQTEIRLALVTPDAAAPAFAALRVASQVLGGSMNSRLSATLREEKGYTYGVHSAVQKMPHRSRFLVATPVDAASAADAITDLVAIIGEFRAEGPTEAEIERSRDEMLIGAALAYQTASAIVRERADQISLGLADGWFDAHRADLGRVTAAQAASAFTDNVPEDRLCAVFIGDAQGILPTVQKFWGADNVEVRPF